MPGYRCGGLFWSVSPEGWLVDRVGSAQDFALQAHACKAAQLDIDEPVA
jgi:hypothetical protein